MREPHHKPPIQGSPPTEQETLQLPPATAAIRALEPWISATQTLDAIRLIELGARVGMICQLTGLDKTTANKLYRDIHKRPSPAGQLPFSDRWYRRSEIRMLQASVVWNLFKHFDKKEGPPGRILIEVYECYRYLVPEPLLDITQVAIVPQLVDMQLWQERGCRICHASYVARLDSIHIICPGCRVYQSFRCPSCGTSAGGYHIGRRRSRCTGCGIAFLQ